MLSANIKKIGLFMILSLNLQTGWAEVSTPKEGSISRALFTSSVQNHEPIDKLNTLSQLISEVFYFTEFKHFQEQTLIHEWSHHGKLSHRVSFSVAGKRWRVHSSKAFKLGKRQEGTWTVKVLNEAGMLLHENQINYIRPSTRSEIVQAAKTMETKPLEVNPKPQVIDKKSEPEEKVAKTASIKATPQTAETAISSQSNSSTTKEVTETHSVTHVKNEKEAIEPSSTTVVKDSSVSSSEDKSKVDMKNDTKSSETTIQSNSETSTHKIEKQESNTEQEGESSRPIWDRI